MWKAMEAEKQMKGKQSKLDGTFEKISVLRSSSVRFFDL
jgi:hypothetical protein